MKLGIQYKNNTGIVKDVDMKSRTVSGYFAAFGNVDHDGDITEKGAFAKSIRERGPQGTNEIWFLNFHKWDQPHNLIKTLHEDAYGAYFEAELPSTSYSNDTLELYERGILKQHSYGFIPVNPVMDGDIRRLKEVYLFEASNVTLGANPNTPFLGMKSATKEEVDDMVSRISGAIKNGKFRDETFSLLDIALKQLYNSAYQLGQQKALATDQPDTSTGNDAKPQANVNQALYNSLSKIII
jgi:HK97 family phage prohead protease